MKLSLTSQNPLEWVAMQTGFIPQPVLLAHVGFMLSKVIWEAVDSGILEAIAQKQHTAAAIASHCNLNEKGLAALLEAMVGLQMVKVRNGKFLLTPSSKRWLLKNSRQSYVAQLSFDHQVCYNWMNGTGEFIRTGKGLQYHQNLQPKEWQLYQEAMEATSGFISQVAAKKIKVPPGATALLDIGGAHGLYSSALLQKHPQLSAQVLDLPEAIAAQAGKQHPFPNRLSFTGGNILTDELTPESYDIVIMANVAHHFSEKENRLVAQKVLRALRPGGSFYILEFFKKEIKAAAGDTIGALQSFFFAFSSTSGLWTSAEIKAWLIASGYVSQNVINFVQLPGFGAVCGKKG